MVVLTLSVVFFRPAAYASNGHLRFFFFFSSFKDSIYLRGRGEEQRGRERDTQILAQRET